MPPSRVTRGEGATSAELEVEAGAGGPRHGEAIAAARAGPGRTSFALAVCASRCGMATAHAPITATTADAGLDPR